MSPGPNDYTDTQQDAEDYRYLREILRDTMADPDAWDGDESEIYILGQYVRWLAAGQPTDEDGHPDLREIRWHG